MSRIKNLLIGIAQINSILGNFELNSRKILDLTKRAHSQKIDLLVFPECSLFGYHPGDLLERASIVHAQLAQMHKLHASMPEGIAILIGAITPNPNSGKAYFNSAVLLKKSLPPKEFHKQLLPTYDVFDEARHIEGGQLKKNFVTIKGVRCLITICEDIWAWGSKNRSGYSTYITNPWLKLKPGDCDLILNLSASPFTDTKFRNRQTVIKKCIEQVQAPMVYVNMVGAQDELVYDGRSMLANPGAKPQQVGAAFVEDLSIVRFQDSQLIPTAKKSRATLSAAAGQLAAIELGITDFISKVGFDRVHLGLSGGLDSALVCAVACKALGKDRVQPIFMPSPFTSRLSHKIVHQLCTQLDLDLIRVEITNILNTISSELGALLKTGSSKTRKPNPLVLENLQSRIRCNLLMAYGNQHRSLLLNTSNKSELAVGYSTLYGDLAGALCPIGDLLKTEIYTLCEYINESWQPVFDRMLLDRAPSAELKPDQKDTDSLPDYSTLDPIVKKLVVNTQGASSKIEHEILSKLFSSEFKRWQAPPILKLTDHAFGRGRRLPIAHAARD